MRLIRSFFIAVSTYSILPVPRAAWDEENLRASICFLPAVGVPIGACVLLWALLCDWLRLPATLFAAVAAVLAPLLSGGIHMDGCMDVVDALASRQPRERMLAIMKDPRCGAFAVLFCAGYLLVSFGLYAALRSIAQPAGGRALIVVCLGFVLSRALTVLHAVTLPAARSDGMLVRFIEHAHPRGAAVSGVLVAAFALAGMLVCAPVPGAASALLVLPTTLWFRAKALRTFHGATGDLCGFHLQLCELACLIGACLGAYLP